MRRAMGERRERTARLVLLQVSDLSRTLTGGVLLRWPQNAVHANMSSYGMAEYAYPLLEGSRRLEQKVRSACTLECHV